MTVCRPTTCLSRMSSCRSCWVSVAPVSPTKFTFSKVSTRSRQRVETSGLSTGRSWKMLPEDPTAYPKTNMRKISASRSGAHERSHLSGRPISVAGLISIRKRHLQQDVAIFIADLDMTMRDIAALQDRGAHQASGIHDGLATSIVQIRKIGAFTIFDDLCS